MSDKLSATVLRDKCDGPMSHSLKASDRAYFLCFFPSDEHHKLLQQADDHCDHRFYIYRTACGMKYKH